MKNRPVNVNLWTEYKVHQPSCVSHNEQTVTRLSQKRLIIGNNFSKFALKPFWNILRFLILQQHGLLSEKETQNLLPPVKLRFASVRIICMHDNTVFWNLTIVFSVCIFLINYIQNEFYYMPKIFVYIYILSLQYITNTQLLDYRNQPTFFTSLVMFWNSLNSLIYQLQNTEKNMHTKYPSLETLSE